MTLSLQPQQTENTFYFATWKSTKNLKCDWTYDSCFAVGRSRCFAPDS